MAAIETPWLVQMSNSKSLRADGDAFGQPSPGLRSRSPGYDANLGSPPGGAPPTHAAFSPVTLSANRPSKSSSKRLSTILVHQKSPLLLATPPQITRALAYSHPFLLPLNKLAGLLSWTSGDAWESFLLVVVFWAVVIYGDVVLRFAGPIAVVLALILGMYGRRFSPLSSSGWNEPAREVKDALFGDGSSANGTRKARGNSVRSNASGGATLGHARANSEITNTRHQKTLDEIVETLKEFTGRCNVLMEPLLELTDFLSTQRTPTSATTRPALTTLFIRLLFCTPFWVALTLPPLRIITTKRIVLVVGTLSLTWHSRVMRVGRALLWRSSLIRRLAVLITGLSFDSPLKPSTSNLSASSIDSEGTARKMLKRHESELTRALKRQSHHHGHKHTDSSGGAKDAGVKFTFIIYENQRRWVGLGWTSSLFAYERTAWTDEHNNPVPSKDAFELPDVEDGSKMRWRWGEDSRWKVDGVPDDGKEPVDYDGNAGRMGWIYYDNKWQNGRRGQDGWGRWTRRRKWYRDAELVETSGEEPQAAPVPAPPQPQEPPKTQLNTLSPVSPHAPTTQGYSTMEEKMISPVRSEHPLPSVEEDGRDDASILSSSSRSFSRPQHSLRRRATDRNSAGQRGRRDSEAKSEEEAAALGLQAELEIQGHSKESGQWGIGDDARMSLE